jgi:sugar diacid utilization regulator
VRIPVIIPNLGSTLRAKTEQLAGEQATIVERIYATIAASNAAYRSLPEPHREDVRAHIALSVELWFKTLLDGESPDADDRELLDAYGRRRVHLGVPLAALLGAIRIGSQELWRVMVGLGMDDREVIDGLLTTVGPCLLVFFEQIARSIGTAYVDEQNQQAPWRQALRNELVCLVFSFPDDVPRFRRTCESLGLDPTIPRVAIALDMASPDMLASLSDSELEQLILSISRQVKIASDDLVRTVHRGRLVIWVPTIRGESMLATDRQMQTYAHALVRAVPQVRDVGVGLMNEGAAGWARSVEEALKALQAGRRRSKDSGVFLYSDLAVTDSVLCSDNVLRYLNSLLERISIEPELLSTLSTYFDQGQHRKLTANAIGIHPNTLNYRLDRIETILGAQLDDPGWISKLDLVVQLRRLSQARDM